MPNLHHLLFQEETFLKLQFQDSVARLLKYDIQAAEMFCHRVGMNKKIVKFTENDLVQFRTKSTIHQRLERRRSSQQAKGHSGPGESQRVCECAVVLGHLI